MLLSPPAGLIFLRRPYEKCPLNTSTPGTKADRRTRPQTTQLALIPRPSLDHSQQTPFRCFFLELLQLVHGGHGALMVTRAQAPGLARGGPKGICAKERRSNGVEGGEIDVTTSAVWTQAAPHRPGRQPNMPGTGEAAAVAGVIVDDGEDEDDEEEDDDEEDEEEESCPFSASIPSTVAVAS